MKNMIKDKFSASNLVNNIGGKYKYSDLLEKVRVISIDDLENILNEKLVNMYSDILKDYFVEETTKYTTEQLEICKCEIVEFFGEQILDEVGKIDRQKLGTIVFNDPKKLKIFFQFRIYIHQKQYNNSINIDFDFYHFSHIFCHLL